MNWIILSLTSALFSALLTAYLNKNKHIDPIALNLGIFILVTPFLFPLLLSSIGKIYPIEFFLIVFLNALTNIIAFTIRTKAIHLSGLSLTMPFLSFTPIFLLFTGFLLLGEFPSSTGLIGILVVVIGSYVLNIEQFKKGVFEPFKRIFKEKGSWMMLIVAFLFSITSTLFKKASNMVDILDFIAVFFFIEFILMSLFALFVYRKKLFRKLKLKKNFLNYLTGAVIIIITELTLVLALQQPQALVAYAISIKRTAILFSVIIGYLLFKEKDFKQKLIGSTIMVLGVVIISVYG